MSRLKKILIVVLITCMALCGMVRADETKSGTFRLPPVHGYDDGTRGNTEETEIDCETNEDPASDETGNGDTETEPDEQPPVQKIARVSYMCTDEIPVIGSFVSMMAHVEGFGDHESIDIQWQGDSGNGFADIPGANGMGYSCVLSEENIRVKWRVTVNGTITSNVVAFHAAEPAAPILDDNIFVDLGITKVSDKDGKRIESGEVVKYTVTITNNGNVPLNNVTINDPMIRMYTEGRRAVTNVERTSARLTNGKAVFDVLDAGESQSIAFSYQANETDILEGRIRNKAAVAADDIVMPDGNIVKPSSETVHTVNTEAIDTALAVAMTSDATQTTGIGDAVTYSISITNKGNVPYKNLTVQNSIDGIVFMSADRAVTEVNGRTVVNDLAAADKVTLTYQYIVREADTGRGVVMNIVTVNGTIPEHDDSQMPANPSGSAETKDALTTHTVTVLYQNADGTQAATGVTGTYFIGQTYEIASPRVVGYRPDIEKITGVMRDEDAVFTVVYSIEEYALTIRYVYADGTTAAKTHFATLTAGSDYRVESPIIEGYTASIDTVSGTIGGTAVTKTVIYTENEVTPAHYRADDRSAETTTIDDYAPALNIGSVITNTGDTID